MLNETFFWNYSLVGGVFNEKPLNEQKKRFTAKYVGLTEVSKPSGR